MQRLYLIICKNKIFIYDKLNNGFSKVYIQGNEYFEYSINNIPERMDIMLELLVYDFNLDTIAELEFFVLENENTIVTNKIFEVLENFIIKRYSIDETIYKAIQTLTKDKKLYIKEFGINYDNVGYKLINKNLIKSEFDLLSYTLTEDKIVKFLD